MPTPIFTIDDRGYAIPHMTGTPDGKTNLSAEQASEITGDSVDALMRSWASVYSGLLTETEDIGSPASGVMIDQAKAQDVRATLQRILRDQHFPHIAVEDIADVAAYAKQRGLDPWSGHLWAEKRYDEANKTMRLFVGVCAEGLRARAHSTGLYAGLDDVAIEKDDAGQIVKATATVYRRSRPASKRKDPFTASVLLENYYPGPGFWDGREAMMLAKCARAAALREAFPAELGGLYDRDELVRSFNGGGASAPRGPRPADSGGGPRDGEPTDRTQFMCALATEYGVKDETRRNEILQQLRNQFSHLASADPAVFYARAWRAVVLQPKLFRLEPPAGPASEAAGG